MEDLSARYYRVLIDAILNTRKNIKTLTLSGNRIDQEQMREIARVMFRIESYLNLSFNKISALGSTILFNSLQSPGVNLKTLDLTSNDIGSDGAAVIANAFKTTKLRITSLDLSSNQINPIGAVLLGEALHNTNNHCLQYLSLYGNHIQDLGAYAVSSVNVKSINLSNNDIRSEGAIHLAENLFFETLTLNYNRIGPIGARAFSNTKNKQMIQLDIWGNDLSAFLWKPVHDRILINRMEFLIPGWVSHVTPHASALLHTGLTNENIAYIISMAFYGESHRTQWETEEGYAIGMKHLFPLAEKSLYDHLISL